MTSSAGGSGKANDATVATGPATPEVERSQAYRLALADDAERVVEIIQAKYDGIRESLATARAEAQRLRAEADKSRDSTGGQ